MAVQVGSRHGSAGRLAVAVAAPHLYVIDFDPPADPTIDERHRALRRRRHMRRVRRALAAAGWAAGSAGLVLLVVAGTAGLR